jgi:hypothetical protein
MTERCELCQSTDGVHRYAVTIDGEPLRLAPLLCAEHGGRYVVRMGMVLGTLRRSLADTFRDASELPAGRR